MTKPVKPVADLVPGPASRSQILRTVALSYRLRLHSSRAKQLQASVEDGKLRLVEVTIRPGETTPMHGDPYPSVLAYNGNLGDSSHVTETWLDPNSPLDGQGRGPCRSAAHLHNLKSPTLRDDGARELPHKIHNGGTAPLHYYRIEYKRIDGDDLAANWKKWYPWMQYMHSCASSSLKH